MINVRTMHGLSLSISYDRFSSLGRGKAGRGLPLVVNPHSCTWTKDGACGVGRMENESEGDSFRWLHKMSSNARNNENSQISYQDRSGNLLSDTNPSNLLFWVMEKSEMIP